MTALAHLLAVATVLPCLALLLGRGGTALYRVQTAAVAAFAAVGAAAPDPAGLAVVVLLVAKAVLLPRIAPVPPSAPAPAAFVLGLALVLLAAAATRPLGSGVAEDLGAATATLLLGLLVAVRAPVPGLLAAENGVALAACAVPGLAWRPLLLVATASMMAALLHAGRQTGRP